MGNGLTQQIRVIGAVEADLMGAVTPEANPSCAQGVAFARGYQVSGEGMLPDGVDLHVDDLEFAGWGFPASSADGNVVGGDRLSISIQGNLAIAQTDNHLGLWLSRGGSLGTQHRPTLWPTLCTRPSDRGQAKLPQDQQTGHREA